jgi:thiamine biosynthesis lipoprotein
MYPSMISVVKNLWKSSLNGGLFCLFLLPACSSDSEEVQIQHSGWAQGTTYSVKYVAASGTNWHDSLQHLLLNIDKSLSGYVAQSILSRINRGEVVEMDAHFQTVFLQSKAVWKQSNGAFDPTVKPLVDAWGFGPNGRVAEAPRNLDSLRRLVGFDRVGLRGDSVLLPKGMTLDFNAIAQGYTADAMADWLVAHGVNRFMVEIGGEVRAAGTNIDGQIWRIGLDEPTELSESRKLMAIVPLNNAGMATSGNYRKYWVDSTGQKMVHTISPVTGLPVSSRLLSATIVASNAALADGYATAAMVKGWPDAKAWIQGLSKVEAYLVYSGANGQMKVWTTAGFPSTIAPKK